MAKLQTITLAGVASVIALIEPALAQKGMTVEELMKPYDAKSQSTPSPAAPDEEPRKRTRAEEERLMTWARESGDEARREPGSVVIAT
jgi:hypothetical protein